MPDGLYLFMGVSHIILAVTSLTAGIVVYFRNRRSSVNKTFAYFSILMTLWASSYFFPFFPNDAYLVLLSERLLHLPANFIAVAHLHFICAFLGIHRQKLQKRIITAGYLVGLFFLFFIPTSLFLKDAVPKPPLYFYPNLGIVYHFWLVGWLSLIAYSVYLLFKHYKLSQGIKKQQIKYVLIGDILTFSTGSTNFLLAYGIPVPPMLNIITLAQTMTFVYVILRYRLINVSVGLMNIVKQVIAIFLAFLTAFVAFKFVYPDAEELNWIIPGVFIIFVFYQAVAKLVNSSYLYKALQLSDFNKLDKYSDYFRNKEAFYPSIEALQEEIKKVFVNKLEIKHARIIPIVEKESNEFHQLIKYFKKNHTFLVTEEIDLKQKALRIEYPYFKELQSLGNVCFPLFFQKNKIIGFFVLGPKPYNNPYSEQELELLKSVALHLSLSLAVTLYNRRMQQEVARKTKALKREIAKNRALIAQQVEFITVTAHEFRTPLSIAKFQLEDLLSRKHRNRQLVADIEVVADAINDVVTLTQTLFDVQQYDLKKVVLEVSKADILPFLQRVAGHYQPIVSEKSKTLKYHNQSKKKAVLVPFDEAKLTQVVHNVIDNSIKFADAIILEFYDEADSILIKISDNGPGIADSSKTVIFEKFHTQKSSISKGVGLGLYLCKKIVKLHKGDIWVEDSPSGGAEFCIRLPK